MSETKPNNSEEFWWLIERNPYDTQLKRDFAQWLLDNAGDYHLAMCLRWCADNNKHPLEAIGQDGNDVVYRWLQGNSSEYYLPTYIWNHLTGYQQANNDCELLSQSFKILAKAISAYNAKTVFWDGTTPIGCDRGIYENFAELQEYYATAAEVPAVYEASKIFIQELEEDALYSDYLRATRPVYANW